MRSGFSPIILGGALALVLTSYGEVRAHGEEGLVLEAEGGEGRDVADAASERDRAAAGNAAERPAGRRSAWKVITISVTPRRASTG